MTNQPIHGLLALGLAYIETQKPKKKDENSHSAVPAWVVKLQCGRRVDKSKDKG